MSVILTPRIIGDVTVVDVIGRITLGEGSDSFRDTIRDLASRGKTKLLLNLADVAYTEASGVGELTSAYTLVLNQGGKLRLLNLAKRVRDLLQVTKLYTVFKVYENELIALCDEW